MLLYHGTSRSVARKALREGLKPRGKNKSTWKRAPSAADSVYLTDAYAPYFSFNAADDDGGMGVVVVDHDYLDEFRLLADEDALEQSSRSGDSVSGKIIKGTMARRTAYYRRWATKYADAGFDASWSLQVLGTARYAGEIPPEAIVKVIEWTSQEIPHLPFIFDPTITLLNYHIMGGRYRYMMQKFAQVETGLSLSEFDKFGWNDDILDEFKKVTVIENDQYLAYA